MITFYKRQEMAVYETELLCASTEMVLFCDSFHDAMREWKKPVGWTWDTNDSRFVIYSGRKHQPQSPNPLICDAGIEQRSAWGEVFITPVYFTMKALCKVPGRIDITMHYTPEGRPILDYLVNELALSAAGFPGKTSAPPASAEIPQIDAGDTAIQSQSDDQAGAPPDQAGENLPGLIDKENDDWYRWLLKCKTRFSNGDMTWEDIGRNFSVGGRTAKRKLAELQARNLPGLEDWPKRRN